MSATSSFVSEVGAGWQRIARQRIVDVWSGLAPTIEAVDKADTELTVRQMSAVVMSWLRDFFGQEENCAQLRSIRSAIDQGMIPYIDRPPRARNSRLGS